VISVDMRDVLLKSTAKSHFRPCCLRDYFRTTNGSMLTRMESDNGSK
jgi:hypothetical protein